MLDPWQWLWDKLNLKLSDMCCDGEITEEEMEAVLDATQLLDIDGMKDACAEYDIRLPMTW